MSIVYTDSNFLRNPSDAEWCEQNLTVIMNGISVCLDEIALEGLDGIALSTLWKRLNSVTPRLLSTLDDLYKSFLWKLILSSGNVQTFMLEKPQVELHDVADDGKTYPFCCINDQESGVRGSCSTYYTRKLIDVSREGVDIVEKKYGNRLVLVASQLLRERVLFGPDVDPFMEISDPAYCLLEWVGRGRQFGRLQSASSVFNGMEYGTNFHYLKNLYECQFVTRQPVMNGTSRTCIIYLPRFHVEHTRDSLAYKICSLVGKMPNEHVSEEYLYSKVQEPKETVRDVLNELCDIGYIRHVAVNESNVGSLEVSKSFHVNEDEGETTGCQVVNFIELVRPFYNICIDDEDEDEMCSAGQQELSLTLHAETPLANCLYQLLESKGMKGVTFGECIQCMGLPFYDIRAALLQLEGQQKATVIFEDVGRQRVSRYIASKILKQQHNLAENAPQRDKPVEPEPCPKEPQTAKNNVDSVNIFEAAKNNDNSIFFTEKFQKRRNVVMDVLCRAKVIEGHTMMRRLIVDREAEKGLTGKMDQRTAIRFLNKLKDTGNIQIFDVDVEVEGEMHKLKLFCDSRIKEDSPEVLAKITEYRRKCQDAMKTKKIKETEPIKVVNKLSSYHVLGYNTKLGFLPKMPRCEMLHIFLFYLIYELAKPDVNMEAWRKKFDWAEHLTPSHTPKDIGKGWFTAASIVMLLPLSLYVKLIGVSFQVDVIDQCINNPATKHMLIKDLPAVERYYLTYRKRHFPNLLESLQVMAALNLITPTTKLPFQFLKDIACHLNKAAVLVDTRESLPHYLKVQHPEGKQFLETVFSFSSLSDIDQYWSMVRDICLTTPLGAKGIKPESMKQRKRTTLRDFLKDEESLQSDIKPRGDGLGAAGFDSGLYCHLRQNWTWTIGKDKSIPAQTKVATSDHSVTPDWQLNFKTASVPARSVSKHTGGKGMKRKLSQSVGNGNAQKKKKLPKKDVKKREISHPASLNSGVSSNCKKAKVQQSTKKPKKKIKLGAKKVKTRSHWSLQYHDQRDLEAARQKEVLRVSFTPQEQKLLFICTLALRIIGKKSTDTCYSDWLWTRDILYKHNYESAKTKTALSISRKHRTIMKNPQTRVNLNICTADCVQEKEFKPYCNLGKSCDEQRFNELVELLKKKYSVESTEMRPSWLPCSMKAMKKQNCLQSALQPRNPEKSDKDITSLKRSVSCLQDIRQGVIRDSIISAVLLENEKYDPHAAYAFLDQFTEMELSSAVRELKKKHIVTNHSTRYGKGRNLALAAFSQRISMSGQRVLDAHFPSAVINEAITFYHQFQQSSSSLRDVSRTDAVEKSIKPGSLTLSEDSILGGHVACILSLLVTGKLSVEMEIPENILRVEIADENKDPEEEIPTNVVDKNHHGTLVQQTNFRLITEARDVREGNEALETNNEVDIYPATKDTFLGGTCSSETPKEDVQTAPRTEFHQVIGENGTHVFGQTFDNHVVEKSTVIAVPSSKISKRNLQKRPTAASDHRTIMEEERIPRVGDRTDINSTERDNGAIRSIRSTAGTTTEKNQGPTVKRKTEEISFGHHPKRNITTSFLDVLSGIEDHLFGSCGQPPSSPKYKVDLESKSMFTCRLTTSYAGAIRQTTGNCHSSIQKSVDPSANLGCDHYNDKIVPARIAGTMIKPVIVTNPCTIRLRLLSSPEKLRNQNNSNDAKELIARHLEMNGRHMPKKFDECITFCSEEFGFTKEDCRALTTVYESIESSKEIGLPCSQVDKIIKQQNFLTKFSAGGLIDVLQAFDLLCEVGLVEVRFVSRNFKQCWAIPYPGVKNDRPAVGTEEDATVVNTKQVTSSVIQTDNTLGMNQIHRIAFVSLRDRKTDDAGIHDKATVSESNVEVPVCLEKEKLLVQGNGSFVSDSVLSNDDGLKNVRQSSNADERESLPKNHVKQSSPISRPWFCMDGQINKTAYNTFHESVLRYIMRYPGVREFTIAKHFVNLIYPVTLHCILRTLEQNRCIQKSCIQKKTTTLFSSSRRRTKDSVQENKVTYYIPTADAVIKLTNNVLK